jgi:hypothetical protein
MDNDFWTKTTNYKLFGKTIFSKEEICSEVQYEGQIYQVQVKQDYYNQEFDINNKDNRNGNNSR